MGDNGENSAVYLIKVEKFTKFFHLANKILENYLGILLFFSVKTLSARV